MVNIKRAIISKMEKGFVMLKARQKPLEIVGKFLKKKIAVSQQKIINPYSSFKYHHLI